MIGRYNTSNLNQLGTDFGSKDTEYDPSPSFIDIELQDQVPDMISPSSKFESTPVKKQSKTDLNPLKMVRNMSGSTNSLTSAVTAFK